jgi:UDP-2,3-diacylglucosamine pyrophosphatase LpxH
MNKYRTLIISDTHIGSDESKPEELYEFLKENTSNKLILNGDIIDIKYLKSAELGIQNIELIYDILEINKTEVIYLIGNHDISLEKYDGFKNENFTIRNNYEHQGLDNKHYFVCHGHKYIFNNFISNSPFLERIISQIITLLNHLKKVHSGYIFKRNKPIKKGLEYYTLADNSRLFIKKGLKIISRYKKYVKYLCDSINVDGVICGHIHLPEIKTIKGKIYMNSGDFVENFSALVETHQGEWKIIYKNE